MVSKEYSEALVEVLEVINRLDDSEKEKIPKKIIEFYEENKDDTYKPNINFESDDVSNFILKNKTREILAGLYIDYLCDNNEEKQQYIKNLNQTKYGYEEKKMNDFNPDNIFDRKAINKNTERVSEEKSLISFEKPNIFKRIWLKIKSFFKSI